MTRSRIHCIAGRATRSAPAAQRGVSLFIALIAMVLLTFAGIALLRSSSTSTLITGNMQFQEAALASGNAGTEAAITWLVANAAGNTLQNDVPASGYYSTSADACNLTALSSAGANNYVDWLSVGAAASCNMVPLIMPAATAGVAGGYTVAYVINRIANIPGKCGPPVICATYVNPATASGSTQKGILYDTGPLLNTTQHYFRITTRTTGPRNTVRYTQTFVVI